MYLIQWLGDGHALHSAVSTPVCLCFTLHHSYAHTSSSRACLAVHLSTCRALEQLKRYTPVHHGSEGGCQRTRRKPAAAPLSPAHRTSKNRECLSCTDRLLMCLPVGVNECIRVPVSASCSSVVQHTRALLNTVTAPIHHPTT